MLHGKSCPSGAAASGELRTTEFIGKLRQGIWIGRLLKRSGEGLPETQPLTYWYRLDDSSVLPRCQRKIHALLFSEESDLKSSLRVDSSYTRGRFAVAVVIPTLCRMGRFPILLVVHCACRQESQGLGSFDSSDSAREWKAPYSAPFRT